MSANDFQIGWEVIGERETPCRLLLGSLGQSVAVVGKTGSGKSALLLSVIMGVLSSRLPVNIVVVDMKGELAAEVLAFAAVLRERLGVEPAKTVVVAPFSEWSVPINPFHRIPGVLPDVQAHYVGSVFGTMLASVGPRMLGIVGACSRALIDVQGTLLDFRRLLVDTDFAARIARQVATPVAAAYLTTVLPTEPAAARDAVRSRLDILLALPHLRAALCQPACILASDILESRLSVFDFSGSPLGLEPTAVFAGSWIFQLLSGGIATRVVSKDTRRVLVIADEWHRLAAATTSAESLDRLLTQARWRRVALWTANQTFSQVATASPSLLSSLRENVGLEILFRPQPDDLHGLEALLPLSTAMVNPRAPDSLLSREDSRREYLAWVGRLPPRHALLVDRVAGTSRVIRTLNLPYDEVHCREALLPQEVRDGFRRGRFGRPLADVLREIEPVASHCSDDAEPTAPVATRARRPRSSRPTLELPS